jgi:hypothetical protein
MRHNAEVLHGVGRGFGIDVQSLHGDRHALKPSVARFGIDLDVFMHLANVRMAVLFRIELRAAEKPGQKVELLDARMRDAVTAQMKQFERMTFRLKFNDVVENLYEIPHGRFAA